METERKSEMHLPLNSVQSLTEKEKNAPENLQLISRLTPYNEEGNDNEAFQPINCCEDPAIMKCVTDRGDVKNKTVKFARSSSLTPSIYSTKAKPKSWFSLNFSDLNNNGKMKQLSKSIEPYRKAKIVDSSSLKSELDLERKKYSHLSLNDKRQIQSIYFSITKREKSLSQLDIDNSCNYTDIVDEKKSALRNIPILQMHSSNLNLMNCASIEELLAEVQPVKLQVKPIKVNKKSDTLIKKPKQAFPKSNVKAKYHTEQKICKRTTHKKQTLSHGNAEGLQPHKPFIFNYSQKFFLQAADLMSTTNTSMLYSSPKEENRDQTSPKVFDEKNKDMQENISSYKSGAKRITSWSNLNTISDMSSTKRPQTERLDIDTTEDKPTKQLTMSKSRSNKYNNSILKPAGASKLIKKEDPIQDKFEKYNTQTISYNSYKNYSHAKIDPKAPFLDRMKFYSIKSKYRIMKIDETVKSKTPKISTDQEIEIVNKLIEDSNRRELAKLNAEHQLSIVPSKSKVNHPKLSMDEWNEFYEKRIKVPSETSKQKRNREEQQSKEKIRQLELSELDDLKRFNMVATEDKVKQIFNRLSKSRSKNQLTPKNHQEVMFLKINKSNSNFHSNINSTKQTIAHSFEMDIKPNLSEKGVHSKIPKNQANNLIHPRELSLKKFQTINPQMMSKHSNPKAISKFNFEDISNPDQQNAHSKRADSRIKLNPMSKHNLLILFIRH